MKNSKKKNRKLKHNLNQANRNQTASPSRSARLVPIYDDSHEISNLRSEVKRLRSMIDRLARSSIKEDSRSISPSPNKSSAHKTPTKNTPTRNTTTLHEIYYDRSAESRDVIVLEKEK